MNDAHENTLSTQAAHCRWDLEDPHGCWDENDCGCFADPCTHFGWDPADCRAECDCICLDVRVGSSPERRQAGG